MDFLPEEIEKYATSFTSPESPVLQQLHRDTCAKVLRPRMLSGHLQGRLLAFISRMVSPRRVLEVGTYTGYSALCLAEGLAEGGVIHTIDHNPELEDFAKKYIVQAGREENIVQHIGEAMQVIPRIDETFDIVFLDADKENYVRYFDLVYPKVRAGGVILADNVLWSGKVLDDPEHMDKETQGIKAFNVHIRNHHGVHHLLLPFRDGLMVVMKNA